MLPKIFAINNKNQRSNCKQKKNKNCTYYMKGRRNRWQKNHKLKPGLPKKLKQITATKKKSHFQWSNWKHSNKEW